VQIYDERVTFLEQGGYGPHDPAPLQRIAETYPAEFKREGPTAGALTFHRWCLRFQLNGPLPARSGFGYNLLWALGVLGAVIAVAAWALPAALWEELQRRWAFYLFCGCVLLWGVNKARQLLAR